MDDLEPICEPMSRLVKEFREENQQDPTYHILCRVFQEHFAIKDDDPRPRQGEETTVEITGRADGATGIIHGLKELSKVSIVALFENQKKNFH